MPKETPNRIKVGYSSNPEQHRLSTYLTSNPDAILLKKWAATRQDEKRIKRFLGLSPHKRVGRSKEVFEATSVKKLIETVETYFQLRDECSVLV